jgi:hypothetical protein
MKSIPTQETELKAHSRGRAIKLSQQPVIVGSIAALFDNAVILEALTSLIFAFFGVSLSHP